MTKIREIHVTTEKFHFSPPLNHPLSQHKTISVILDLKLCKHYDQSIAVL
jgi:hypothetical protein